MDFSYFLVCLVYLILLLFVVSRSDISAGNSLSVPQYSVVPFLYWCLIYLCDMVFTEINDDDDDDNDTEYSVLVLPYCHLAKQKYCLNGDQK